MRVGSGRQRLGERLAGGSSGAGETIGIPLIILLVWLFFEFGRPPRTFGIPMLISVSSLGLWVLRGDKRLGKYGVWWFVLLGVILVGVPLAANGYSAVMTARVMAILLLTVCLPLQSLLTSLKSVRLWIYTFLAVMTYVGIVASMNGGYGPAGANGGQDENYVAAMMAMAMPFAYFLLSIESRKLVRGLLIGMIVVFISGIALAENASRGGFLSLCSVGVYCMIRSPRKSVAVSVLGVAALALALVAGPAFWAEISTTTDFEGGTGGLRLEAWKAGFRMWMSSPLLGVGPGNFPWALGDFETASQVQELGRSLGGTMIAHSLWVELVAELGLVGLTATLVLIGSTWKGLERVVERATGLIGRGTGQTPEIVEVRAYAYAIQASILSIVVSGVFLSLMYYSNLWLLIVVGTALPPIMAGMTAGEGGRIASSMGGRLRPSGRIPRRALAVRAKGRRVRSPGAQ